MRIKFLLASILILFAISLLLPGVSAVGIGSYSGSLNYIVDFSPGLKKTFSFFLVSNAPSVMDYDVSADGNLKDYFTFSDTLFKNVWPGQTREFTVTLQLPGQKLEPGLHDNFICVTESQGPGGGIAIRTQACSIVSIRALYPEKYLKIEDFQIPNQDMGDIADINVGVKSWTESDMSSVKAIIDIFGPSEKDFGKKITTLQTGEEPLPSNAKITLSAKLNTKNFESGEYSAVATVYYDGNNATASTKFRIGVLAVKIVNYTGEVVRNKINKFNVDVESRWNSPIENVYADITILDGKNETLRTPAINLKPWETAALATYYDAAGKKAQYYGGKITLYYGGNSTEHDIKVKMLVNPEEIRRLMLYVAVTTIMVVLIVVIVLISLKKPTGKNARKKKTRKKQK